MFKLAYRNLWRNKRRTVITAASVFFALFFSIIMNAYMDGMWGQMIANTLRTQSGHIEIHAAGYWDDKTVDNFMAMDHAAIDRLRAMPNIDNVSPRIETFALASFGNVSKGVAIMAVSPEQENAKSKLAGHVVEGKYLDEADGGVLIGEGLAKYMKVSVGDTLAFIGQGHFGASAAGLFPVRGILKLAITEMSNSLAYMTLPAAQSFIDMADGYSGILITLKDADELDAGISEIKAKLGDGYEVLSWHFTMQRLLQTAESDKAFGKMVLFILYLIVGFGILGTVIMLANERQREFKMLISLGMQRRRLTTTVCMELLVMSLIGVAAGIAAALPVALWFHSHPIQITGEMAKTFNDMGMEAVIPVSADPQIFINQTAIVLLLTGIAAVYLMRNIQRLEIVNS
jgi:ABC-type lipoprotein release transport system permease subunit